jgi:hypothetical protein
VEGTVMKGDEGAAMKVTLDLARLSLLLGRLSMLASALGLWTFNRRPEAVAP